MPNTLQDFFASAVPKAAADLETALLRLPEDKRTWRPMGDARTALDQVAECALINGFTAETLKTRAFSMGGGFEEFYRVKAELARDGDAARALLHQNAEQLSAAIRAVPDADLETELQLPWGPMTVTKIIANAFWNMSYHEGQINYLAAMLGGLA